MESRFLSWRTSFVKNTSCHICDVVTLPYMEIKENTCHLLAPFKLFRHIQLSSCNKERGGGLHSLFNQKGLYHKEVVQLTSHSSKRVWMSYNGD